MPVTRFRVDKIAVPYHSLTLLKVSNVNQIIVKAAFQFAAPSFWAIVSRSPSCSRETPVCVIHMNTHFLLSCVLLRVGLPEAADEFITTYPDARRGWLAVDP